MIQTDGFFLSSSSGGGGGVDSDILIQYELPYSAPMQVSSTSVWTNAGALPKASRGGAYCLADSDTVYFIPGGISPFIAAENTYKFMQNLTSYMENWGSNAIYKYDIPTETVSKVFDLPALDYNQLGTPYSNAYSGWNYIDGSVLAYYDGALYLLGGSTISHGWNSSSTVTSYGAMYFRQALYKLDLNETDGDGNLYLQDIAEIPFGIYAPTVCAVNQVAYAFGGFKLQALSGNIDYIYSTYTRGQNNPVSFNGIVDDLKVTTTYNTLALALSPISGGYEVLPNPPAAFQTPEVLASCAVGRTIYIVSKTWMYAFDTVAKTYKKLADPMTATDTRLLVPLTGKNAVLAVGGGVSVAQEYDIESNTWTTSNMEPVNISGANLIVVGNTAYRFGGAADGATVTEISKITINYNAAADTAPVVAHIPEGYYYHASRELELSDGSTIGTTPTLAAADKDVKLGTFANLGDRATFVYIQKEGN